MGKKEQNNVVSEEVLKRQKEREEREKKEKEEQKKRDAERLQKKKERQARIKKKEKKERKRINDIVTYPFKTLFQISAMLGLFTFIFSFFWFEYDTIKSLLYTFFVFSIVLILIGTVLLMIYYVKAEEKIKEEELAKKEKIEKDKLDEEKRIANNAKIGKELKEQAQLNSLNFEQDLNDNNQNFNINDNNDNNDDEIQQSFEEKLRQNQMEDQFINENFKDIEESIENEEFFK